MAGSACPSASATAFTDTPFLSAIVAYAWRRSWNLTPSSPLSVASLWNWRETVDTRSGEPGATSRSCQTLGKTSP